MNSTEDYYSNRSNHGSYQYVRLSQLIDGYMLEVLSDSDSYIKHKPRSLFIRHAKRGIAEMNADLPVCLKKIELSIGDDLSFIFPEDFVDWVGVYKVGDNLELLPLEETTSKNNAGSFLQDHDYNLIFDSEGNAINVDGNNIQTQGFEPTKLNTHCDSPSFQLDTSKLSKYGSFVVDRDAGAFYFDSSLSGRDVVLSYVSDGLHGDSNEDDLFVHKYYEEPLLNWVYWKLIEHGRNIPEREK